MKWTQFPDEFDTDGITILLDVVRKKPVSNRKAALAAANVLGYGLNSILPAEGTAPPANGGTVNLLTSPSAALTAVHSDAVVEMALLAVGDPVPADPSQPQKAIDWKIVLLFAKRILDAVAATVGG